MGKAGRHEHKLDFSDRSGGDSCFRDGTDPKACGEGGAGISGEFVRTDPGASLGDPLYIGAVSFHTGIVFPVMWYGRKE